MALPISDVCPFPVRGNSLPFKKGLEFLWLGQAGFLISFRGKLILLDPYLSNWLVEHAKELPLPFSHERMMPPPLDESVLVLVDYILITHGHEDHLDPGLIPKLASLNPRIEYLVPPGCRKQLLKLGAPEDRIRVIDYTKGLDVDGLFRIEACPSAHPEANFNASETWALSYLLELGEERLFFAGDTTLYPGLIEWLKNRTIDLLVLPANGRDPDMEARGIVGNMSLQEGIILSRMLDTDLLATHYGMFAFNTIDPRQAEEDIRNYGLERSVILTETDLIYRMTREKS